MFCSTPGIADFLDVVHRHGNWMICFCPQVKRWNGTYSLMSVWWEVEIKAGKGLVFEKFNSF
jgi:hypothetical protein